MQRDEPGLQRHVQRLARGAAERRGGTPERPPSATSVVPATQPAAPAAIAASAPPRAAAPLLDAAPLTAPALVSAAPALGEVRGGEACRAMCRARLPPCAYTVAVQNLGWRGRAERGEDPAKWYDAEGEP